MISFIIIGRNESQNLKYCFDSVKHACRNQLQEYEIIYIDSDSKDESINIADKNGTDKIIKIETFYNAAVARNVGVKYTSNDILFFLDGDMTLIEFDSTVFSKLSDGKHFIRCNIKEKIIDYGNITQSYLRKFPDQLCGGAFVISKKAYYDIGEMDPRLKKGQDYDFFIRANKKGIHLIEHPRFLCEHITEGYQAAVNLKAYPKNSALYRGYLFRKNLHSLISFKLLLREYYPLIFLIFTLLISLVVAQYLIGVLLLTLFFVSLIYKIRNNLTFNVFVSEFLKQLLLLFTIFFFKPPQGNTKITVISQKK